MALNDCWWWVDAIFQDRPDPPLPPARRRTHDIAIGALIALSFIVTGAVLYHVAALEARWSKERAILQRQIEDTRALVVAVVEKRVSSSTPIQDSWGVDLRVKDNSSELIGNIEAASAGPDLTFGTADDISEDRSLPISWDRTGDKLGKTVGDFGIGAMRGMYRSAKDHLAGQKEENAHANPDASPNEGANP